MLYARYGLFGVHAESGSELAEPKPVSFKVLFQTWLKSVVTNGWVNSCRGSSKLSKIIPLERESSLNSNAEMSMRKQTFWKIAVAAKHHRDGVRSWAGIQVVQVAEQSTNQGAAMPLCALRRPGAAGHRGDSGVANARAARRTLLKGSGP